jgi:DNA-binding NtrC family response regulator
MALILIIDDSVESLTSLSEYVHSLGHDCRLATSWKMALEIMMMESFDLMICNHDLEDGNGIWFLTHLNSLNMYPKSLILSNHIHVKESLPSENGLIGFCLKPFAWHDFKLQFDKLIR